MNEWLEKYRYSLTNWEQFGKNYNLSIDWTDLNNLAVSLGSTPFNLGCGDCRRNLAEFILAKLKENNSGT